MKKKKVLLLVGFPGAGKTSVGEQLSKTDLDNRQRVKWVDLDQSLEKTVGRTITNIVRVEGEKQFRALEREEFAKLLSSDADVISVGGGTLIQEGVSELLSDCAEVVLLAVSRETSLNRIIEQDKHSTERARPLLIDENDNLNQVKEKLNKLFDERRKKYEAYQNVIHTDWANVMSVAGCVFDRLKDLEMSQKMKDKVSIPVDYGHYGECLIEIGSDLYQDLGDKIKSFYPKASNVVLVSDEAVSKIWGDKVAQVLKNNGYQVCPINVPSGENSKSLDHLETITQIMLKAGIVRDDVMLALGGGVVGDLAGLASSLYMRGIGLVQIPTTVVAQVDSAVGGKTAVNVEGGKNILGTFNPGKLVVCDISVLSTLPEREFRSGLAEVVKYGLIHSEEFFNWLVENSQNILMRDVKCLRKIVEFSVTAKLGFVQGDVSDVLGRRTLLNFGHTLGHAVEKLMGYGTVQHGEAVAIGMVFATHLGEMLGITKEDTRVKLVQLLKSLSLPIEVPKELSEGAKEWCKSVKIESAKDALSASSLSDVLKSGFFNRWESSLKADKKRVTKAIQFVVVPEIGKAHTVDVSVEKLVNCIAWHAVSSGK